MNKTKIGFYCSSTSWGGLEINVSRHAKWMKERAWQVLIFCVENSPLAVEATELKLDVVYVKKNKKYYDIVNAIRLKKLVKIHNINLLWIRDNRDVSICGLVRTLSIKGPKLIYQQAMQIKKSKKDIFHTLRFKKINAWITTLPYLAEQVKTFTSFNPEKLHIIPIGVEIERLRSKQYTNQESREKLNLPQNKKIIGIIGRIDKLKGQLFLVQAIHELNKRGLNYDLLIMGDPTKNKTDNYLESIHAEIEKNSIMNQVHFVPHRKDIELFFYAIDFFALASKNETYGMVTIEALIFGLPIIGTNSAGTPEILGNGKYGRLYEYENMNDFCSNIQWMDAHPEETKEMAVKANEMALRTYAHHTECEQIEEVILKLVQ